MSEPGAPQQVDVARLPPQLRMLVQRIGYAPTLQLIRARGGQQVAVPKTATADRVLAQIIGRSALAELVEHHGGERLELPKEDKILIQLRDQELFARREQGATESELARDYGLTRRWVLHICARLRQQREEADRQGRLFEPEPCARRSSGAN